MSDRLGDVLPVSVRAFAVRSVGANSPSPVEENAKVETPASPKRRYPRETLVFDTETSGDPTQALNIGVYRIYRDHPDASEARVCIEEGFFCAADLPVRDPSGFSALRDYCFRHPADTAPGFPRRLALMRLDTWLALKFRLYAYRHRRRCSVVGYNLPFDLGRIARYWSPAGGYYRGGFSLGLWGEVDRDGHWHDRRYCPRLVMKSIDPRRTLFGWGSVKDGDLKIPELSTRFVDLHTLVFALTDRNVALDGKHGACALFGEPYIKKDVEYGVVDEAMLDYARDDVRYTVRLYNDCLTELDLHVGVALEPHRLYSPATVGTRYLEAMGLTQPLIKFTNIDPVQLGWKR